ncbi:hypothetical protein WA588_002627, partial [Blastocystis sp. NMH]
MQVSLKTKADLDFILHFVDDNQAAAVEWLKFIGNANEGYPVFLLDLPYLFQKRDKDITNEFVLLIHTLRKCEDGYGILLISGTFQYVSYADYPFVKSLLYLIPQSVQLSLRKVWAWRPGVRFHLFWTYCTSFLSFQSLRKLSFVYWKRQFRNSLNVDAVSFESRSNVHPTTSFQGSTSHRSSIFSPDQTVELMLRRTPRRVIRISHHTLPRIREEKGPSLQDQCDETMVTRFVQQACAFIEAYGLDCEGIFRQNGETVMCEQLLQDVIAGQELEPWVRQHDLDVIDVCHALKLYLMRVQLIPFVLYPFVEGIQALTDPKEIHDNVVMILRTLESPRYFTLKRVVELFGSVISHSDQNHMNLNNLLTCINLSILPSASNENAFSFGRRTKFLCILFQDYPS